MFKNRTHDNSLIKKAKRFLVQGVDPGKVALLLRLPYLVVKDLYDNSWSPACRKATYDSKNAQNLAFQHFISGFSLVEICKAIDRPLFNIIELLRRAGLDETAIFERMPDCSDPLFVEYTRTLKRHRKNSRKPIKLFK